MPVATSSASTGDGNGISIDQSHALLVPSTNVAGVSLDHSPSSGPTTKSAPVLFLNAARTWYADTYNDSTASR